MGTILLIDSGSAAHTKLLFMLFVMFVSAKLMAEIFERLRQPAVAGEILAGILIGPSVFNLVQPSELTSALAEIGVILLLFHVGLHTKPSDVFKVGARASGVAVLGVVFPFLAGYAIFHFTGHSSAESVFVGAAMVATSVGITARVLGQLGVMNLETSRIILGAAVIDDVIGLLMLAVVSSFAKGQVDYAQLGLTAAMAIGFTLLIAFVGTRAVNQVRKRFKGLRSGHGYLISGLSVCLGLCLLASYIGVAAIVGAFLAGMALSESVEGTDMPGQAEAVTEFLAPFFLANIGMQLSFSAMANRQTIILAVVVTIAACVTKIAGCGLAVASKGWRSAMQVGVGMMPRGEVGIVVAQLGLAMGVISQGVYGVVLVMAVVTTLVAPPLLIRTYSSKRLVRNAD